MNNTIKSKINTLYDIIYSKQNKEIKQYKIDETRIELDNIKISKKDTEEYHSMIDELLDGKFSMFSYNQGVHNLVLKRSINEMNTDSIMVNICPYKSMR